MPEPRRRSSRFSYYARLTASEKRTYRKSDEVGTVTLSQPAVLASSVDKIRAELAGGTRARVELAVGELCRQLTEMLAVPRVRVLVRSVRPSNHTGELHGLYTWEEGKIPVIEVWMRTARNRRVVQFRTFLRTLIHEICHHLDFTLLGLADTFHTEGFFRRESSLMRQLAGRAPQKRARPATEAKSKRARAGTSPQLNLFSSSS
jgi:hypothetical protein